MKLYQALMTWHALLAGNYFFELMADSPDWIHAAEISWYQLVALFAAWFFWRNKPMVGA